MSHKLAVTGKITSIETIEGADRIVSANVSCGEEGQWTGVVGKDKFKPEDLVTVYLQDAVLKPAPEYNFLKSSNYRIKICRLRGSPSECLIMPHIRGVEGDDLTEELGVTKYEKPIPAELGGVCIGGRPYGIPKTDEDNFQRARKVMRAMHGKPYYISIKSDGSSGTWYWNNGKFGCCSRELDLTESDTNTFWVLARKYGVREYMDKVGKNVAIQFEAVGPKIQGNPMGLTGFEARAFNFIL